MKTSRQVLRAAARQAAKLAGKSYPKVTPARPATYTPRSKTYTEMRADGRCHRINHQRP